jgi:spermidine synthase
MEHEDAMPGWSVERLNAGLRVCLKEERLLFDGRTPHQRLRLFENPDFGRVLTLDGIVQTTTADEFIYHEMLAHVPILAHGAAGRVLIVGGGDGGLAREVLRHPGVAHVTMVEIDAAVVEFARTWLPSLSQGAFDDPRLELVIGDGAAFVAGPGEPFDVVLVDSTDPIGPGAALFTRAFYAAVRRRLASGGVLATQNGVPFLQPDELAGSMRVLQGLFRDASCYLGTVPSYVGGPMAFGWATDGTARTTTLELLRARYAASGLATRYYTPEVHQAAFALPGYVRALLG